MSRRIFRPKPPPLKLGEVLPAALDAHDIARAFGKALSTVYGWDKNGMLRRFELKKPMGSKRWSGRLLQTFLDEGGGLSSARRPTRRFAEAS